MDTLQTLQKHVNGLPIEVWYAATLLLVGVLTWFLKQFVDSLRETLKELKVNVEMLSKMMAINTHRLDEHDDDIKEIKDQIKPKRR